MGIVKDCVCFSAANDGVSQPVQQDANNNANSRTPSYVELDISTQTPVNYQQLRLPSLTGGPYEYIDLVNTSSYEQLNTDRQRPAHYEQLAT